MNNGKGYILCHVRKAENENDNKTDNLNKRKQMKNNITTISKKKKMAFENIFEKNISKPTYKKDINEYFVNTWKLINKINTNEVNSYVELYSKIANMKEA